MTKTTLALRLAVPALAALTTAPLAAEDYLQLSTGVDYSSGDYGDAEDTDMLAIPFSLKYQAGDFYLRASVSYLDVKGPDGLVPGEGGVTPGTPGGAITSRSGIGDVNLAVGYSFFLGGRTYFDAVGKVKLPTASEAKFLGTGSTDFTLQGELLQGLSDQVSIGLIGGRRFNGSSDVFALEDVWLAGGGIYYTGEAVTLGLDYEWREGATATAPDISEATASLTYKLNDALRLQGYGYTGFADGSPDLGGGLQVLYRFGQ